MRELKFLEDIAALELHAKQATAIVLSSHPSLDMEAAASRAKAAIERLKLLAENLDVSFVDDPR